MEHEQEYDRIIADCTETLDASPNDADRVNALNKRGLAFTSKGEFDRAFNDFTEAILRGPTAKALQTLCYNRGRCQSLRGAYEDAIKDLTEAIRLNRKDADAFGMRGLAWQNLGDFRKAIVDYDLAIRNDPESADAYHNRGNAWVRLGKLRKGIADLSKAIRLDPKSASSHTSRGVAWRRKGRYANALADYERALELEPDSVVRRAGLAEFLAICPDAQCRNGARALQLATEACELTNYSNVDYLGVLAAAHAETGDFDAAILVQTKALNLSADDAAKKDMLGYIERYTAGVPCRMEPPSWRQRWA